MDKTQIVVGQENKLLKNTKQWNLSFKSQFQTLHIERKLIIRQKILLKEKSW